jgi:NAD(P)H-dependent FMN reductase
MTPLKVLVVPGSNRSASLNVKLAGHIAQQLILMDVDVTRISLADYPLPIYDGDYERENGIPEPAHKLIAQFKAHDAVVIVSPEYNGSIPPVLKNAIDWMSRDGVAPFRGRVFAVAAASSGVLGGARVLLALRQCLEVSLGALIIPEQFSLPAANRAFDGNGALTDEQRAKFLNAMLTGLIERATLLRRP